MPRMFFPRRLCASISRRAICSRLMASGYSARTYMYPSSEPMAYAQISIPSSTACGSPSRTERSMKAPGSPSSALQMTYFLPGQGLRIPRECPLHPRGESRAAPARAVRKLHLLDDRRWCHRQDLLQRGVALVREVLVDGLGVDDAAVGEDDPLLLCEVGIVRGDEELGHGRAAGEVAVDDGLGLCLVHVPVEERAAVRLSHLHQGLRVAGPDAARWPRPTTAGSLAATSLPRCSNTTRAPAAIPQELIPTAISACLLILQPLPRSPPGSAPRPRSCPACRR